MSLPVRESLQISEEMPHFAYFLLSGIASVVVPLPGRGGSETALIGREGMTAAVSLLGSSLPPTEIFMQVAGSGYRIPFATMRELFAQSAEIRGRILEQAQQLSMTTSQVAACNIAHEADARLARWLLMVQDRTELDSFQLTQEFMAEMLGTRRSTVVVVAGSLQRAGLIEYSRGKVKILSREGLETAACDCYPVTRRLLLEMYS